MSTNSISRGGIDAQLTSQTAAAAVPARIAPKAAATPAAPPAEATNPTPESAPDLSENEVRELVADLKKALETAARRPFGVEFRQDERAHGYVIEIRSESGDLVRQFPPEKVLNLRSKLDELSGMVIDQVT